MSWANQSAFLLAGDFKMMAIYHFRRAHCKLRKILRTCDTCNVFSGHRCIASCAPWNMAFSLKRHIELHQWKRGRVLTSQWVECKPLALWLTFFSAEIPCRGDLGLGEIKGRSSSTSLKKSALYILKFFFQSSSKHLSSIILRHQRSVCPDLSSIVSSCTVSSWNYGGSVLKQNFLSQEDVPCCFFIQSVSWSQCL